MKFNATIQWLDTEQIEEVTLKIGDVENEDDDDIFFYLESESEIEGLRKRGVNGFVIVGEIEYLT